jgi:hypothetical protein
MDIVSPGCKEGAALGMKMEASLGLPAERIRLKNGFVMRSQCGFEVD